MFCSLGYLLCGRVALGVGMVISNHVPGEPEKGSHF